MERDELEAKSGYAAAEMSTLASHIYIYIYNKKKTTSYGAVVIVIALLLPLHFYASKTDETVDSLDHSSRHDAIFFGMKIDLHLCHASGLHVGQAADSRCVGVVKEHPPT